jgi:hypothetical protein
MLVDLDFFGVLCKFLAPVLTHAVGKDGGLGSAKPSNVNCIPPFVLTTTEWLQPYISFTDHQVIA